MILTKKALRYEDLVENVPDEDNVQYIDYWKEPAIDLLDFYEKRYNLNRNCSSECKNCQIAHIEKYKNKYPNRRPDKEDPHAKSTHAWQISCPFIPENYLKKIPQQVLDNSSQEEIEVMQSVMDPVTFAAKYFGWKARKHQELMLRCQSKRKVLRWGRRAGKSESFAIEILWHAFTKNIVEKDSVTGEKVKRGLKILVVTPYESQVVNIFEMLNGFIDRNEATKAARVKYRKSPHHHLEFANGCVIKGFTTGANEAASVRGQDAHVLVLDECDYLSEGDYKTVMPIATSHPNVLVRASSTPTGKRERFWRWSTENPKWKEFYFPSAIIDKTPYEQTKTSWVKMREEMRPDFSRDEWLQEIMAIFIASATGVYQPKFVTEAMKDYTYEQMVDLKKGDNLGGWRYTIGVDWNSNAGTEISVLGLARTDKGHIFKVMQNINVPKQDFTQYAGLTKLTETIQFWKPDYVYVDAGHGATNWEMLRLWAEKFPIGSYEKDLQDNIKRFDFGSKVEIRDPITKQRVKHPAKAYMIENSVRKFEDRVISFSKDDDVLKKQLLNYIVKSRSESGKPIYDVENKQVGDHRLDALNLALVAWAREEGIMGLYTGAGVDGGVTSLGIGPQIKNLASKETQSKVPDHMSDRVSLRESLTNQKENIAGRNDYDKVPARTNLGGMSFPDGLFTKTNRPGFADDTEHLYEEKRKASMRRLTPKRNRSWRGRKL